MDNLDFMAEMLAHPEIMRFWPKCYDRDEASDWVWRQQARYIKDGVGDWLVWERATGRPVGQADLLIIQVNGREEVGLGRSFTGYFGDRVSR